VGESGVRLLTLLPSITSCDASGIIGLDNYSVFISRGHLAGKIRRIMGGTGPSSASAGGASQNALFPTTTSFVIFISYMALFINQGKHCFKKDQKN